MNTFIKTILITSYKSIDHALESISLNKSSIIRIKNIRDPFSFLTTSTLCSKYSEHAKVLNIQCDAVYLEYTTSSQGSPMEVRNFLISI